MAKLYNLARMTTTTTGSDVITLGTAVAGRLDFETAGVSDGETISYGIVEGNNSEVGRGVYGGSGSSLTRVVLASTNGGSPIVLGGSAHVYITTLSQDIHDNTTAAYASRPAASKDGNLFLPSDGFSIQRDTGSAWVPWGPIFPLTAPVLTEFAWINQETATAVETKGGIYLLAPAQSGDDFRILKKAAPSTPYTITAVFLQLQFAANYSSCGISFRQSSDGKFQSFASVYDSGTKYQIAKYNSVTSHSASYASAVRLHSVLEFFRITDDGTNRICQLSYDGQNWYTIHTVGRTDFLTADEVGFYANSNNATYPAAMTLLSWKEA